MPAHRRMELLGNKTILAYADNVIVIGNSRKEYIVKMADLFVATKPIELKMIQGKTKYIVIDRRTRNIQDLIVGDYIFQAVTDFKYLGTNIKNANYMQNKIKLRISVDPLFTQAFND